MTVPDPAAREPLTSFLERQLDFKPPDSLVRVVAAFVERAGGRQEGVELLCRYTGTSFAHSFESRYERMPLELLPFLDTGGDGCSFGYLVLTPELSPADYPMAHACPGEYGSLALVGDDTCRGLEHVMSAMREGHAIQNELELAWLNSLGLHPSRFNAQRPPVRGGAIERSLRLPKDWRFEPTRDGTGVAAPVERFGGWKPPSRPTGFSPEDLLDWMRRGDAALESGQSAAALWYFKEIWQRNHELDGQIFRRLVATYQLLGKHLLAEMCQKSFHWHAR